MLAYHYAIRTFCPSSCSNKMDFWTFGFDASSYPKSLCLPMEVMLWNISWAGCGSSVWLNLLRFVSLLRIISSWWDIIRKTETCICMVCIWLEHEGLFGYKIMNPLGLVTNLAKLFRAVPSFGLDHDVFNPVSDQYGWVWLKLNVMYVLNGPAVCMSSMLKCWYSCVQGIRKTWCRFACGRI